MRSVLRIIPNLPRSAPRRAYREAGRIAIENTHCDQLEETRRTVVVTFVPGHATPTRTLKDEVTKAIVERFSIQAQTGESRWATHSRTWPGTTFPDPLGQSPETFELSTVRVQQTF